MRTTASPRDCASPASIADSLPKLRLKEMYRTRGFRRARSRSRSSVPSVLPSSTNSTSTSTSSPATALSTAL